MYLSQYPSGLKDPLPMKNRNTSIIFPTVNGKRHGLVGLTHFGEMSGCPCLGGIVIFEVKQFSVMPERGNMTLLVACHWAV